MGSEFGPGELLARVEETQGRIAAMRDDIDERLIEQAIGPDDAAALTVGELGDLCDAILALGELAAGMARAAEALSSHPLFGRLLA